MSNPRSSPEFKDEAVRQANPDRSRRHRHEEPDLSHGVPGRLCNVGGRRHKSRRISDALPVPPLQTCRISHDLPVTPHYPGTPAPGSARPLEEPETSPGRFRSQSERSLSSLLSLSRRPRAATFWKCRAAPERNARLRAFACRSEYHRQSTLRTGWHFTCGC